MAKRTTSSTTTAPASYLAIAAGSTVTVGNWLADRDYTFTGWGEAATYTSPINTSNVTNPPPQSVYQTDRWAPTVTYAIPNLTPNATYTVRLHFAECWFTSAGQRLFNVSINGAQVLTNFDVFQAAGGENIAIAKSFTVTADATGTITILLAATVNNALISGIEITGTPTTAPVTAGLSISAGNSKAVGSWVADTDYTTTGYGGAESIPTAVSTSLITNPAPQAVYQSERWAKTITYTIPNLTPSGAYAVTLSFVESYFATAGSRLFNVKINGGQVLTNFDIFRAAGGKFIEIAKSYPGHADTNGQIKIELIATANYAVISGVQAIGASSTPTPAPIISPTPTPTSAPTPPPTSGAHYPTANWPQWPNNAGFTQTIPQPVPASYVRSYSSSAASFYSSELNNGLSFSAQSFYDIALGAAGSNGGMYIASANDPYWNFRAMSGSYPGWSSQLNGVHVPNGAATQGQGLGCDCHFWVYENIDHWTPGGVSSSGNVTGPDGTSWPDVYPNHYEIDVNDLVNNSSCGNANSASCTTFNGSSNSFAGTAYVSGGGGMAAISTGSSGYYNWQSDRVGLAQFPLSNGYGSAWVPDGFYPGARPGNLTAGYTGSATSGNVAFSAVAITAQDMIQGAINHMTGGYVACLQNGQSGDLQSKAYSDYTCSGNSGWAYGDIITLTRTPSQIASDYSGGVLTKTQEIFALSMYYYGFLAMDTTGNGYFMAPWIASGSVGNWSGVQSQYSLSTTSYAGGAAVVLWPNGPLPASYVRYMEAIDPCAKSGGAGC